MGMLMPNTLFIVKRGVRENEDRCRTALHNHVRQPVKRITGRAAFDNIERHLYAEFRFGRLIRGGIRYSLTAQLACRPF